MLSYAYARKRLYHTRHACLPRRRRGRGERQADAGDPVAGQAFDLQTRLAEIQHQTELQAGRFERIGALHPVCVVLRLDGLQLNQKYVLDQQVHEVLTGHHAAAIAPAVQAGKASGIDAGQPAQGCRGSNGRRGRCAATREGLWPPWRDRGPTDAALWGCGSGWPRRARRAAASRGPRAAARPVAGARRAAARFGRSASIAAPSARWRPTSPPPRPAVCACGPAATAPCPVSAASSRRSAISSKDNGLICRIFWSGEDILRLSNRARYIAVRSHAGRHDLDQRLSAAGFLRYQSFSNRPRKLCGDRGMTKTHANQRKVKNQRELKNADGAGKGAVAAKRSATVVMMRQSGSRTGARTDTQAASDRRAQGKALRETVPREAHAGWKAPKDRCDPIDLLVESNQGRMLDLIPIRFGRMMQSPFTFYRGSASVMAADLATTPAIGATRAGLRRRASAELRRLRHAGAADRVRHQRPRRNTAGAVGMGRQAADREHGDRRTISPADRDRGGAGGRVHGAVVSPAHGRLFVHAGARGLVRHASASPMRWRRSTSGAVR